MGLEMRINGVKNMRPRTVAVRVRPERRSKMPPEITSVASPTSWVELGEWSLSFCRMDVVVVVGLVAGYCRSAIVE